MATKAILRSDELHALPRQSTPEAKADMEVEDHTANQPTESANATTNDGVPVDQKGVCIFRCVPCTIISPLQEDYGCCAVCVQRLLLDATPNEVESKTKENVDDDPVALPVAAVDDNDVSGTDPDPVPVADPEPEPEPEPEPTKRTAADMIRVLRVKTFGIRAMIRIRPKMSPTSKLAIEKATTSPASVHLKLEGAHFLVVFD